MNNIIIILALSLLVNAGAAFAQTVSVTTSSGGAVQLQWSPDTTASRTYLIYRKLQSERTFPSIPMARVSNPSCATVTQRLLLDTTGARVLWALSGTPANANLIEAQQRICGLITGDVQLPAYRYMARVAGSNWRVARICGTFYEDATARPNVTYDYEIRVAEAGNVERTIHPNTQLRVTGASSTVLPQIGGLQGFPSDGRIQVTWIRSQMQIPCVLIIERSKSQNDWSRALVREILPLQLETTITGVALGPQIQSYIDEGSSGDTLHVGQTYYYRLRWLAVNGVTGPYSPIVGVTPVDRTPPAAAKQLSGVASRESRSVTLTWNKTYFDVNGRKERMGRYLVYRLPVDFASINDGVLIGTVMESDVSRSEHMMSFFDRQPAFDPCRTVPTIYVVFAIDSAGNSSSQSAPLTVRLDDITPPERVKNFRWMSNESLIKLQWQSNADCGVQRYNIYRSLCDYGSWNPCPDETDSSTVSRYRESRGKFMRNNRSRMQRSAPSSQNCGGPFMLIGSVEHTASGIGMEFVDETVPEKSPLCYAYLVSAQDSSGNQSVQFPIPDPVEDVVLCANLVDKTAPPPASVARFSHEENRIVVRATTLPVQDLIGFHLYRTTDTNATYSFVKTMLLDLATMRLSERDQKYTYTESAPPSCELIPQGALVAGMNVEFIDDSVVPYVPYWYKVTTVDRSGNESLLGEAVNQATFTYGRKDLDSVSISVVPDATGNSLQINLSCATPPGDIYSYALFRASSRDGQYRQLGGESGSPTFIDTSVLRGVSYWYKGIVFLRDQRYTNLSSPAEGVLP